VANIPVVYNQLLQKELESIDRGRIVALTVSPSRLQLIRLERQKHLQNVDLGTYTDPQQVKEEVSYALQLYRGLDCCVIDVTYKSIEEASTDVMRIIYAHSGMKKGKMY
ncbi:MAG TPA: kinase/pyrophosphorylase, partial [Candidatus Kapabacteria bacterium]|nr:kinase/pyrophosphorylase [Candidatus Kapabacteria bacterium]